MSSLLPVIRLYNGGVGDNEEEDVAYIAVMVGMVRVVAG